MTRSLRTLLCSMALLLVFALSTGPALARDRRGGAGALRGALFPPEMLMRHADELDLQEDQRERIIAAIQEMEAKLVPLQWELREQGEQLREMVEQSQIDEKAALSQAGRVSGIEAQIKQMHLALLIRIKNALTDEQRAKLDELKARRQQRRRDGRWGGPPQHWEGPTEEAPGDTPPFRD